MQGKDQVEFKSKPQQKQQQYLENTNCLGQEVEDQTCSQEVVNT